MIQSKSELKRILKLEEDLYLHYYTDSPSAKLKMCLLNDHDYLLWRFMVALRKCEYYKNTHNHFLFLLWQSIKNKRGSRLGITIWENTCEEGLRIWHYGSIVINGNAKIGKNVQLHGMNCIGNKGPVSSGAPVIEDNVDLGVGAVVIGDVRIAKNSIIGANSVVTKDVPKEGSVVVGAPAKVIR